MKKSLLIILAVVMTGCSLDDKSEEIAVDYASINEAQILDFLDNNNLTAQKSSTGLYYIIEELGTGDQPVASSNVTVAYKGYYTDGTVFDESDTDGVSFGLQNVIPGWTEGITYFNEGGSGILLVPSRLGYGSFDYRGIPGGSVLIFEVTLVAIN